MICPIASLNPITYPWNCSNLFITAFIGLIISSCISIKWYFVIMQKKATTYETVSFTFRFKYLNNICTWFPIVLIVFVKNLVGWFSTNIPSNDIILQKINFVSVIHYERFSLTFFFILSYCRYSFVCLLILKVDTVYIDLSFLYCVLYTVIYILVFFFFFAMALSCFFLNLWVLMSLLYLLPLLNVHFLICITNLI